MGGGGGGGPGEGEARRSLATDDWGLVSKETVVLRRWGVETNVRFINRV